jgi:hypothetical protein
MKVSYCLLDLAVFFSFLSYQHHPALACDGHVDHQEDEHVYSTDHHQDQHEEEDHRRFARLEAESVEECRFTALSPREEAEDTMLMQLWMEERINGGDVRADNVRGYTIPVYFHVLQPDVNTGSVSDSRISDYITYLNGGYEMTPFTFALQTVTRSINSYWANNCDLDEVELEFKSELKVGGADVLNVYICNSAGPYAGYSYLPSKESDSFVRDGVVIVRGGGTERLNTLVHEVVSNFCRVIVKQDRLVSLFAPVSILLM